MMDIYSWCYRDQVDELVGFAIRNGHSLQIKYQNYEGEQSTRTVSNIKCDNSFLGYNNNHIRGYCSRRQEERSFRISRIY